MLAAGVVAVGASSAVAPGTPSAIRDGGTLRVGWNPGFGAGFWDPKIDSAGSPLCASLLRPPDTGFSRRVPEAAAAFPRYSRRNRTWTYTLRGGFRFSDGTLLTGRHFAHTAERFIGRDLSPDSLFARIVGALEFAQGMTPRIRGITASGRTLVMRLQRGTSIHERLELEVWMSRLCPSPPNLPVSREPVLSIPMPSAGPYYLAAGTVGRELLLQRNPRYGGRRRRHLARIHIRLDLQSTEQIVGMIDRGELDTHNLFGAPVQLGRADDALTNRLARRFGVNRRRFFAIPNGFMNYFVFNMRGGAFARSVPLRQAVNFALDRPALVEALSAARYRLYPSGRIVAPETAGSIRRNLYPLRGPNLRRARALASGVGRIRATYLAQDSPGGRAQALVLARNLRAIGIDLQVEPLGSGARIQKMLSGRGWDIAFLGLQASGPDAYFWLDGSFHGRWLATQNHFNFSGLNRRDVNAALRRIASLRGHARYAATRRLERKLVTRIVPVAPFARQNNLVFVSARVGCVSPSAGIFQAFGRGAGLNLTTACLRR